MDLYTASLTMIATNSLLKINWKVYVPPEPIQPTNHLAPHKTINQYMSKQMIKPKKTNEKFPTVCPKDLREILYSFLGKLEIILRSSSKITILLLPITAYRKTIRRNMFTTCLMKKQNGSTVHFKL